MEKKYLTILGIVLVTAIVVSAAGIGYAAYMGNTYSENNSMDTHTDTIDIYKKGVPITKPMTMPAFVRGATVQVTDYRVATNGPGSFVLQCQMGNNASWVLIESMSLTIEYVNIPTPFPFGVDRSVSPPLTGLPTDSIAMDPEHTFVADGQTLLYYDFTISITFADIDVTEDPSWESLASFEGAQFIFAFTPTSS